MKRRRETVPRRQGPVAGRRRTGGKGLEDVTCNPSRAPSNLVSIFDATVKGGVRRSTASVLVLRPGSGFPFLSPSLREPILEICWIFHVTVRTGQSRSSRESEHQHARTNIMEASLIPSGAYGQ